MAYQYGAPSIVGDDLFGPASTTPEQLYDMEPPKPSFKSFVRGVAPVPFSDQPKVVTPMPAIPPPPPIPNLPTIKPRRSSSIYTTATRRASNWPKNRASSIYTTANGSNRQSTWSRKPSSTMTAEFYLQQSYSDPDLYANPLQFEDSPRLSDISSGFSPVSPDAFHWDQPDTRDEQPPLLLQPTTYTSAPSPGNRSKATSARSSVESKAPVPTQAPISSTSSPQDLFQMTRQAMAASPATTEAPTPRVFAFERESSAYVVPLLDHERMLRLSKSGRDRITSQHSAQPHLIVDTGSRRKEPGRKSAHWSAALDPAAALRSHAIESSGSSEVASEPEQPARPSMRTSRFLSQLLDMYISDWTLSPVEDLDVEENQPQETTSHARMLSEDYAAELYEQRKADKAAQEVSPSGSPMTPEPLNWKQMVASKLPTSPLSPKLPKLPRSPEAPKPPVKDAPAAVVPDAEEQLKFTSNLRSGFNTAHERTKSRSKSVSSQTPSQTSSKPSSFTKKNLLTNLGSRLPSKSPSPKRPRGPRPLAKAATHPKPATAPVGLRKPDSPQPLAPSSPTLMTQGLLNAKNLLNRTDPPKSPTIPQFDYNRPITRSPPSKDHSQQIRRALEEARKERQGGREGSADMITAIRTAGMPQEKDDPFGIYSNPGPAFAAPPPFSGNDEQPERGRGRFHLGHMRIDSKARSKSQKRRDSIKKRIRVVGEVDPNSAIGVGIVGGVMGPAAVHSPASSVRSRTDTFGTAFSSPDREGRDRSGSSARWERPRVVPGAVGYTPIPAPHKIHDGIGPGTTHAALAGSRIPQGVARMDFAPGGLEVQRTW